MTSLHIGFLLLTLTCILGVNSNSIGQETSDGDIWAVLVAGSNSYFNYRHQADVCHAYHVLRKRGIPESNIVVMMYNDIANSSENPRKGVIINEPGGYNVYPGVPHDYVGKEVTPENFLKVLLGDPGLAARGKKVLKSGPNDNVFVYFTDHGAPGIIAFPNSELAASQLNQTIGKMYEQKKYGKMVLYVEACESGSMFDGILSPNINVYVTTAANPSESSYACYYDDEFQAYLADCYSINWIDDSEKPSVEGEKLGEQYEFVRRETTESHVMDYGDLGMADLPVSQFQGANTKGLKRTTSRTGRTYDAVSSRDVPLEIARRRYLASKTPGESRRNREIYERMQFLRNSLKKTMYRLANVLSAFAVVDSESLWREHNRIENLGCYEAMVETFNEHCINISRHPHSLNYLHIFVNLCNAIPERHIEFAAQRSMVSFCQREVDFSGVERVV